MRCRLTNSIGLFALLLAGCGGSAPPPKEPGEAHLADSETDVDQPELAQGGKNQRAGHDKSGASGEKGAAAQPKFTEDMTVSQAIDAVPPGSARVNIDPETLAIPLQNPALYEPCKLPPSQHFKIRVAVWQGKAVGLDITAMPKNPKAEKCIADQVKGVTWKDKVASLNTVDYDF